MDWVRIIRRCFQNEAVLYSSHARREMKAEAFGEIVEEEVFESASTGEVIEEYPADKPYGYPSALVFGVTRVGRPLHLVCAYDAEDDRLVLVTVYQPDPTRWEDLKRRKK